MGKFVSVDSGKYNTKFYGFDSGTGTLTSGKRRTKISEGTFDDDMLEIGTILARVDGGPVYKIGNGARVEAEMITSKKDEIHKVTTLVAIAEMIGESSQDVDVAIGIPFQTAGIPEQRIEYKDFILPDTEHTVELKTSSEGQVRKVQFTFGRRLVYPESIGVVYEFPQHMGDIAGIVDIGSLNTNNTYCAGYMPVQENSFTDEMGGHNMLSGLAGGLSSELNMRVDVNLVIATLRRSLDKRMLYPKNKDEAIQQKSKEFIDLYLLEHVKNIKRKLDTKQWPTGFMNLCMIGGTVRLLRHEITEVFGDVFIPEKPDMVNASGFLKKMCSDAGIDITGIAKA